MLLWPPIRRVLIPPILDNSFGSRGKVTTDFADNTDSAIAVAVQGTKVVACGTAGTLFGVPDFALARYRV